MPKISVIIPVYNVEKYLDICLDTVLAQTFKDFEAVCINDGSSDNSLNILEHYQKFDKRIKIIQTENKGLSHARNKGIKEAKGEYITFVDSDDYISEICLESMNKNLDEQKADFLYSNIIQTDNITRKFYIWDFSDKTFFKEKEICTNEEKMPDNIYFSLHTTAYAKMYRYDFIKDFRFEEGMIFEDIPYFANCFLSAKKISFCFEAYYYYRLKREGSILNNSKNIIKDLLKAQNLRKEIFINYNKFGKYKEKLFINDIKNILYRFLTLDENKRKEALSDIKSNYKNFNFNELENIKDNKLYILMKNIEYLKENEFYNFSKSFTGVKNA